MVNALEVDQGFKGVFLIPYKILFIISIFPRISFHYSTILVPKTKLSLNPSFFRH